MYSCFKRITSSFTLAIFIITMCLNFSTGAWVIPTVMANSEPEDILLAYDGYEDIPIGTEIKQSDSASTTAFANSGLGFGANGWFETGQHHKIVAEDPMKYPNLSTTPNYLVAETNRFTKIFNRSEGSPMRSNGYTNTAPLLSGSGGTDAAHNRVGQPGKTMWLSVLMDPELNTNQQMWLSDNGHTNLSIRWGVFQPSGTTSTGSDNAWGIHVPRLYGEHGSTMNGELAPTINSGASSSPPDGSELNYVGFSNQWNPYWTNPVVAKDKSGNPIRVDGTPTLVVLKIEFGTPQGNARGLEGTSQALTSNAYKAKQALISLQDTGIYDIQTLPDGFRTGSAELGKASPSTVRMFINPDLTQGTPLDSEANATVSTMLDITFQAYGTGTPKNKRIDELRLGTTFESVTPLSTQKFPVNKIRLTPTGGEIETLKGGIIEGSNDGPTSGFEIITSVPENPVFEPQTGYIELNAPDNNVTYQYVKYRNPGDKYGKIAELEFYNNNFKISGEPFGTDPQGGYEGNNTPDKAFDGDSETWFESTLEREAYVGLDLGADPFCAVPSADPIPGRYESPIDIVLTTETEDAEIYYTTDGSIPSKTNGTLYQTPIRVEMGSQLPLKAIAVQDGKDDSDIFMGGYGIGVEAPVIKSMKSYHLGNSLTDTMNTLLRPTSIAAGFNHIYQRHTMPGAPTRSILDSPNISNGDPHWRSTGDNDGIFAVERLMPLDVITVQPFVENSGSGIVEIAAQKEIYDIARKYNPQIRFFVYGQWPQRHLFDEKIGDLMSEYEYIRQALDDVYDDDPMVGIIPSGLALIKLKEMVEAGEYPDSMVNGQPKKVTDFLNYAYYDGVHLTEATGYLTALTAFSVIYKQSPEGLVNYETLRNLRLPADSSKWSRAEKEFAAITEEQAKVLQQIAWETCINYRYSGVYDDSGTNQSATSYLATPNNHSLFSTTESDGFTVTDGVLTKYSGQGGDITIPDGVTEIGEFVFAYNKTITSVNIPDSVTKIGDYAFFYSNLITNVTGGGGLTHIGKYAFANCQKIGSMDFVPDTVSFIGNSAFSGCRQITSAKFPSSLTVINDGVFSDARIGGALSIPATITDIGNYAFAGNSITSVNIPKEVTEIGTGAFNNNPSLREVTFEDGIGIDRISDYAFSNCPSLTSIDIPNGVETIGKYAFWRTSQGNSSNWWVITSGLSDIKIPKSVTSIGEHAFLNNNRIQNITVAENNPNFSSEGGVLFNKDKTKLLNFPVNKTGTYTIPSSVTGIAPYAFHNSLLTTVTIPDSVEIIGDYAFARGHSLDGAVVGLQSIVIPDGVTSIGKAAFQNNLNLKTAEIADSVTSIGDYAFNNCRNLETVTLSSSITEIGQYMFRNNIKLKTITIPEGVTSIKGLALGAQPRITGSGTAVDGVTPPTYENISMSIKDVVIPESVGDITFNAFDLSPDLVIVGVLESFANTFADDNGINFRDINAIDPDPTPEPSPDPTPEPEPEPNKEPDPGETTWDGWEEQAQIDFEDGKIETVPDTLEEYQEMIKGLVGYIPHNISAYTGLLAYEGWTTDSNGDPYVPDTAILPSNNIDGGYGWETKWFRNSVSDGVTEKDYIIGTGTMGYNIDGLKLAGGDTGFALSSDVRGWRGGRVFNPPHGHVPSSSNSVNNANYLKTGEKLYFSFLANFSSHTPGNTYAQQNHYKTGFALLSASDPTNKDGYVEMLRIFFEDGKVGISKPDISGNYGPGDYEKEQYARESDKTLPPTGQIKNLTNGQSIGTVITDNTFRPNTVNLFVAELIIDENDINKYTLNVYINPDIDKLPNPKNAAVSYVCDFDNGIYGWGNVPTSGNNNNARHFVRGINAVNLMTANASGTKYGQIRAGTNYTSVVPYEYGSSWHDLAMEELGYVPDTIEDFRDLIAYEGFNNPILNGSVVSEEELMRNVNDLKLLKSWFSNSTGNRLKGFSGAWASRGEQSSFIVSFEELEQNIGINEYKVASSGSHIYPDAGANQTVRKSLDTALSSKLNSTDDLYISFLANVSENTNHALGGLVFATVNRDDLFTRDGEANIGLYFDNKDRYVYLQKNNSADSYNGQQFVENAITAQRSNKQFEFGQTHFYVIHLSDIDKEGGANIKVYMDPHKHPDVNGTLTEEMLAKNVPVINLEHRNNENHQFEHPFFDIKRISTLALVPAGTEFALADIRFGNTVSSVAPLVKYDGHKEDRLLVYENFDYPVGASVNGLGAASRSSVPIPDEFYKQLENGWYGFKGSNDTYAWGSTGGTNHRVFDKTLEYPGLRGSGGKSIGSSSNASAQRLTRQFNEAVFKGKNEMWMSTLVSVSPDFKIMHDIKTDVAQPTFIGLGANTSTSSFYKSTGMILARDIDDKPYWALLSGKDHEATGDQESHFATMTGASGIAGTNYDISKGKVATVTEDDDNAALLAMHMRKVTKEEAVSGYVYDVSGNVLYLPVRLEIKHGPDFDSDNTDFTQEFTSSDDVPADFGGTPIILTQEQIYTRYQENMIVRLYVNPIPGVEPGQDKLASIIIVTREDIQSGVLSFGESFEYDSTKYRNLKSIQMIMRRDAQGNPNVYFGDIRIGTTFNSVAPMAYETTEFNVWLTDEDKNEYYTSLNNIDENTELQLIIGTKVPEEREVSIAAGLYDETDELIDIKYSYDGFKQIISDGDEVIIDVGKLGEAGDTEVKRIKIFIWDDMEPIQPTPLDKDGNPVAIFDEDRERFFTSGVSMMTSYGGYDFTAYGDKQYIDFTLE